jgi:outer membrane protein TolC
MRNNLTKIFLTVFLIGLTAVSCPPGILAQGGSLELKVLIEEALRDNAQIQSAYHAWKAAGQRIPQATALADPMAGYTYTGERTSARDGAMEEEYRIAQEIPFPGKRRLAGLAARDESREMKENYEMVKREVIQQVKAVYYDLCWVDRAVKIINDQKFILQDLETVALRKYETRQGPQQDALRVNLEKQELNERLLMLGQQRKSLQAKLNSLLNRPVDLSLEKTEEITAIPFDYSLEQVMSMADEMRPELRMAKFSVSRSEKQKALAKMDLLPDFTFSYNYIDKTSDMTGPLEDAWEGMVEVNVPLWSGKQRARVREAQADLLSKQGNWRDVKNKTAFDAQDAYFMVKSYQDIMSLYNSSLLPQSEQTYKVTKIGYETGASDFFDVLDAQRKYLQVRTAYYRAFADYHKSVSMLERMVGKDFNDFHADEEEGR